MSRWSGVAVLSVLLMLVWVLNSQPSSILEQLTNTNFEHFSIQLVEVAVHALPRCSTYRFTPSAPLLCNQDN